jgi:hypothetical protein
MEIPPNLPLEKGDRGISMVRIIHVVLSTYKTG